VVTSLVRAIATGVLMGLLSHDPSLPVNYINAPALAAERGITATQAAGSNGLDYPNLIACRAYWKGGERLLAGVLFGGGAPRIVQVDNYGLEAKPEGIVLVMQNRDVPGVIGQVGTILSDYQVNIGEWRLGRNHPGGEALSFINLDSEPPPAVLDALSKIKALTKINLVKL
jgi:D-3-phosphoglycerate dehydrogenase